MRDTIVIGAGLSGLMGALALADAGRRPLVLAKGQGAMQWAAGTIDVWGAANGSLRAALGELITTDPGHPYARAGAAGVEAAIDRFRALMESARYPYVGSLERNVLLPTALGALRPAAFFPATMAAGDMRLGGAAHAGPPLLLAGFHELRDFFPPMAAENLTGQGIPARGVYLTLPPIARRLDFNTRVFAQLFDDPAFREDVGRQLRAARGDATRIGLPAVLGLRDPLGAVAHLQALSGAQIFEIPTLPPSVPGMRLFTIFREAIVKAGGRLQIGAEVLRGEGADGALTAVYSAAAAREQTHRANLFLLATGGVAGGGVRTDHTGSTWETALGLPLQAPGGRGEWFAPRFLNEAGHPIYRAGIATNPQLQPLDAAGAVVYRNVAVSGAALAGSDPIRERCYSGMALATGWRAGQILSSEL
ncbi:MAG: glycerol-3-phosphate dehydrogenase subunit GlpB [Kouleothrix sp.]|jgi:glycerol-3-phosphate dehydrogenase subunit B|nr:glycerol-3-phosphate dehydrogenase subunit GlpB [Kouleothrix sp.]